MGNRLAWIILCGACAACGTSSAPAPASTPDAAQVALGNLYLSVDDVGGRCGVTLSLYGEQVYAETTQSDISIADLSSGAQVALTATAQGSATLGLWHHTSHDSGSGDPGTITGDESDASVVLGEDPGCVWICCPDGSAACPTADPCG